jgi:uncharacterized membrane protein YgdD (TMEM256/DUF423 family)
MDKERTTSIDRWASRAYQLFSWAAIAGIAILSLVPGELRPQTGVSHYFEHFIAYSITAVALTLAYRDRIGALGLLVGIVLYAGTLETLQLWVPGRAARISDFGASSLGGLVGIGLVLLAQRMARRTQTTNNGA